MRISLVESYEGKPKIHDEKLPVGVLSRVTYPVCRIGVRNHNNRVYEGEVFESVLREEGVKYKLKTRTLYGCSEHPQGSESSKVKLNKDTVSHIVSNFWIDESTVYQTFDILDTEAGRFINTLLLAECLVGTSTRASGDLEECVDEGKGDVYYRVVPEKYVYETTDFTSDASTLESLPAEVIYNSVHKIRQGVSEGKIDVKSAKTVLSGMQLNEAKELIKEMDKIQEAQVKVERDNVVVTVEGGGKVSVSDTGRVVVGDNSVGVEDSVPKEVLGASSEDVSVDSVKFVSPPEEEVNVEDIPLIDDEELVVGAVETGNDVPVEESKEINESGVRYIFDLKVSRRDMYGNCYGYVVAEDTETGKSFSLNLMSSWDNVNHVYRYWDVPGGFDRSVKVFKTEEVPIREFNRAIKGMPKVVGTAEQIAKALRKGLGLPEAMKKGDVPVEESKKLSLLRKALIVESLRVQELAEKQKTLERNLTTSVKNVLVLERSCDKFRKMNKELILEKKTMKEGFEKSINESKLESEFNEQKIIGLYVKHVVEASGYVVTANSLTLLESCKTFSEVDTVFSEIRREMNLLTSHSGVVEKSLLNEDVEEDKPSYLSEMVGRALNGMR